MRQPRRQAPIPPSSPLAGQPVALHDLFNPDTGRLRGFATNPTASSLPPGIFAELQNIRLEDGLIEIRPACGNPSTVPWVGTANYRGSAVFEIGGVVWFFIAVGLNVGQGIDIYAGGSVALLTKITGDPKYHGSFPTDITDGYVNFSVVYNRLTDKYYVIAQNGKDPALVHALTGAPLDTAPSNPITVPDGADGFPPMPCWDGVLHGNNNFGQTTSTGGTINFGSTGAVGDKAITLNVPTTVVAGHSAMWYQFNGDTLNFTYLNPRRQLIIVYSSNDDTLWDKLDVFVRCDGALGVQLYQLNVQDYIPVRGPLDNSGRYKFIAFSVDHINVNNGTIPQMTDVTGIQVVWKANNKPANAIQAIIYGIFRSGTIPGGTAFAYTYQNTGSQAESRGIFLPPPMVAMRLDAYLVSNGASVLGSAGSDVNRAQVPVIEGLYYNYRLQLKQPSNTDLQRGVDRINIYRRDPGAVDYYFASTRVTGSYSTGGHIWFPQWTAETFSSIVESTPFANVDVSRPCPDAFQKSIPIGQAMLYANNRLYVGARASATKPECTLLYVSEDKFPFRFREEVRYLAPSNPDLTSGVRNDMANEEIQAFRSMVGESPGISTVFMWTNMGLYMFDGYDAYTLSRPRRISDAGTRSPWSIATDESTMYWLDQQMRIQMRTGGQQEVISRLKIDNLLESIDPSQRPFVSGLAFRNRYYLAYARDGASQNRFVLVYNQFHREFESNDYMNDLASQGLMMFHKVIGKNVPTSIQAWVGAAQPQVYQMYDPTIQGNIVLLMTSREFHNGMWKPVRAGRMGIVCDDSTGQIITDRIVKPTTGAYVGLLDLNSANAYTWRWDVDNAVDQGKVTASGLTLQFQWTGNVPAGMKIFGLSVELEGVTNVPEGPDILTP